MGVWEQYNRVSGMSFSTERSRTLVFSQLKYVNFMPRSGDRSAT